MKNRKSLLLFALLTLFIFPMQAWAAEDIQASLVQPAIYKAKAGDPYSLQLEIVLPKGYETKYKSFAVSMMLDPKLDIISEAVESPKLDKSTYRVSHTKMSQSKKNLVTLSIDDLKVLKGSTSVVFKVKAQIAEGQKDVSSLGNSYVLSYIDMKGIEGSFQKDTVTTAPEEGKVPAEAEKPQEPVANDGIIINPIEAYSSLVTGKAMADSNIRVYRGQTIIAYGRTAPDGTFEMVMNPQPGGETLRFEFITQSGSKFKEVMINNQEEPQGAKENTLAGMEILKTYLDGVSKLPRGNLKEEKIYQLDAAISLAKYFSIKEGLTSQELELGISQLKDAYKAVRPAFMQGYEDKTFRPTKSMVRAEVAVALAKTLDNGRVNPSFSTFKDVDEAKWYAGGVGLMEKEGLISGYKDGTFRPNKAITRGEFAAIVAKYMNLSSTKGAEAFKDVKKTAWNYDIIRQVSSAGIMNGSGDGKFRPNDNISRQEVAKVINKITGRTPNEAIISQFGTNPFKDVKKTAWSYYEIMEVTAN